VGLNTIRTFRAQVQLAFAGDINILIIQKIRHLYQKNTHKLRQFKGKNKIVISSEVTSGKGLKNP
tara:strand:+ start:918 stop:1112 length:195 start_codon:yes stop_codon:yes gene_type:complete